MAHVLRSRQSFPDPARTGPELAARVAAPFRATVRRGGDSAANADPGDDIIDFDTAAHGEMLPWAIDCLRTRLPAMLTEAEGDHLVSNLDFDLISRVIDEVQEIAEQAQQARRAVSNS